MRNTIPYFFILLILSGGCKTSRKADSGEEPLVMEVTFTAVSWVDSEPAQFSYALHVDSVIQGKWKGKPEAMFSMAIGAYHSVLMDELCSGERMHSRDALYAEYLLKPGLGTYRMEVFPDLTFILWKEGGKFRWFSRSEEPQVVLEW